MIPIAAAQEGLGARRPQTERGAVTARTRRPETVLRPARLREWEQRSHMAPALERRALAEPMRRVVLAVLVRSPRMALAGPGEALSRPAWRAESRRSVATVERREAVRPEA